MSTICLEIGLGSGFGRASDALLTRMEQNAFLSASLLPPIHCELRGLLRRCGTV